MTNWHGDTSIIHRTEALRGTVTAARRQIIISRWIHNYYMADLRAWPTPDSHVSLYTVQKLQRIGSRSSEERQHMRGWWKQPLAIMIPYIHGSSMMTPFRYKSSLLAATTWPVLFISLCPPTGWPQANCSRRHRFMFNGQLRSDTKFCLSCSSSMAYGIRRLAVFVNRLVTRRVAWNLAMVW
jgi:hypothetical protein